MKKYFEYGKEEIEHIKKYKHLKMYIDKIGFVQREVIDSPFEAIINTIISQQISNKVFESIWNKFKYKFNSITPSLIYKIDDIEMRECGISSRKIKYMKSISKLILDSKLNIDQLEESSDEEVIGKLINLDGIGHWSAQMVLLFGFKRKNVISFNDLVIIRAMKLVYKKKEITKKFFNKVVKKYSPYATISSFYLWEIGNNMETYLEIKK